jgi:hypothetical protein
MVVNFDSLPTRVCASIPRASSDYYTPCARTTKIASQIAANPEITYLRSRPRPQDLLLDQTSEEWCKSHAEPAGSVVGKESSGVKLMLLPPDRRRHLCHTVATEFMVCFWITAIENLNSVSGWEKFSACLHQFYTLWLCFMTYIML